MRRHEMGPYYRDLVSDLAMTFRTVGQRTPRPRIARYPPLVPLTTSSARRPAIDDPVRFRRSRSVGAYFGLTPRRHAAGEVDWTGRISNCGDTMVRSYLFEAAGVLLTHVPHSCALKACV